MNQLVDDFGKELKTLDENLTCEVLKNEITEKRTVLIYCKNKIVFTLTAVYGVPAIFIEQPIVIDKDNSVLFGDLIKLCGEYLDAFFGDDEHDN